MKKVFLLAGGLLLISTFVHSGNTSTNLNNSGSGHSANSKENKAPYSPRSTPIMLPLPTSHPASNSSVVNPQSAPSLAPSPQANPEATPPAAQPNATPSAQQNQPPTCTADSSGNCTPATQQSEESKTCSSSPSSPGMAPYQRQAIAC
jgi:hypothetical protein